MQKRVWRFAFIWLICQFLWVLFFEPHPDVVDALERSYFGVAAVLCFWWSNREALKGVQ